MAKAKPLPVAWLRVRVLCPSCGEEPIEPQTGSAARRRWVDVNCPLCGSLYRARWEVPLAPEGQ